MKLQEKMIFKIAAIFFFVLLNLFALSLPVRAASLTLSASPSSLIGNALNPVQFTVTDGNGTPVSGADVKWPGGTIITCSTDSSGQCTANISGGSVTTITLTSGGTGYTSAPLISFYGGNGSGAAATANISGGLVTSITLTSGGTGYTSAPIVSFSGGGGSSASATASISLPDTTFTASKTGYANGSFSITFYTITPLPPLNIFATPSAVVADMATPVQFTVQNNAKSPISGADITGNNGDFICSTNSSGQCSTPVNINTATVYTASKIGYTGDSTTITIVASPFLILSASSASVFAGAPTSVQFTLVDNMGNNMSGIAIKNPSNTTVCTTDPSGQCTANINISAATAYTASVSGYANGSFTISIKDPVPLAFLTLSASPSSIDSPTITSSFTTVTFTVRNGNNGTPVSGAAVKYSNGIACSTSGSGQCSANLYINSTETFKATASGYADGSATVSVVTIPSLSLSASPSVASSGISTSVQFTVADTKGNLITGNAVNSVSGGAGGTGCTSAPAVSFSGGGGSGATATARVDMGVHSSTYGQVTAVNVTFGGNGYTFPPSVHFSGGGCTTYPTAIANISGGKIVDSNGNLICHIDLSNGCNNPVTINISSNTTYTAYYSSYSSSSAQILITLCVPVCKSQCNYGQSDGCGGTCAYEAGNLCDAGFCTVNAACDGGGNCAGSSRNCDDANLCTDDSCSNTLSQCTHTNNTKPCSDGKKCTDLVGSSLGFQRSVAQGNVDQCSGGICVGYNATCVNSCQSTTNREYNGSCDSATGSCGNYTTDDCLTFGNVGYCRDNVCTPDSCQHPFTKATCNISPSPSSLNVGEGSILNWTTACGMPDTGSITDSNGNNLGNNFPLAGSLSVFPTIGTGYTMAVGNYHDTAEVHPLPEGTYQPGNPGSCATNIWFIAPACTITADKKQVIAGNSTTLSWTTANALSGTISGGGLAGADAAPILSGTMETPSVNASTTFTMTPFGPGGAGSCSVTITLLSPPTGGLVPCGRLADNTATTEINESQPCDLCAAMYMLKKIINFVMELVASIAVFAIVIAGLLHAFSAGDPGKIELAKSAITYAFAGLALIFAAWLVIAIILQGLGYADINTWNQVNCNLQK